MIQVYVKSRISAQLVIGTVLITEMYTPHYHGLCRIGFGAVNNFSTLVQVKYIETKKVFLKQSKPIS